MTAEVFDFEGAGERYKFLLQPVKDLATNWNLNIAKTLEEYIQKVVDADQNAVLTDRNGRRKVFNFAEAALLIHGTTSVYVKKVEYMHQLALNFFDQLKEDKSQEKKRKKGAEEINASAAEDGDDGEEGAGEGTSEAEPAKQREKKQKPKVSHSVMRNLLERLSHRRLMSLPLVPIAFFPLSDFEKTNVPLYTRTNNQEQIGKKDDFRINSCHIHESVALLDIKNAVLVEQFSAPQPAEAPQHEQASHRPTTGIGYQNTLEPLIERSIEEEMEAGMSMMSQSNQQVNGDKPNNDHQQMNGNGMDAAPDDDGFSNFGGGDDGMDDGTGDRTLVAEPAEELKTAIGPDDLGLEQNNEETNGETVEQHNVPNSTTLGDNEVGRETQRFFANQQPDINMLTGADLRPSTVLGQTRPFSAELRNSSRDKQHSTIVNWEDILEDHLDPTEVVTEQSRPYQKSNCVAIAAKQIKARDRRIERECRERGVPNERSIKGYIDTQMFRRRLKSRAFIFGQFNSFLMDQAILALNPLVYEEEKRRTDLRKKRRKQQQAYERAERAAIRRNSQRSLDPVLDYPEGDEDAANADGQADGHYGGYEQEEFEDGIEELIAEENLPNMDGVSAFGDDNETNLGDVLRIDDLDNSLGGIRNVYTGFQNLVTSKRRDRDEIEAKFHQSQAPPHHYNTYDDTVLFEGIYNPDDLPQDRPPSQMDYDEIIAYHLRKYWTASEAAITKMGQKVHQWEMKMTIALEEEETHRRFDTKEYGDELLDLFGGKVGSTIDFSEMLDTVPNDYDQSRYLLMSLILANMGNVEVQMSDSQQTFMSQKQQPQCSSAANETMTMNVEDKDRIKLKLISRTISRFDLEDPTIYQSPIQGPSCAPSTSRTS